MIIALAVQDFTRMEPEVEIKLVDTEKVKDLELRKLLETEDDIDLEYFEGVEEAELKPPQTVEKTAILYHVQ